VRLKLLLLLALQLTSTSAIARHKEALPDGALQQGSLANPQLIQDAMLGVVGKAATLGCKAIDSYEPYVMAMPAGTPGARVWRERWVVSCAGKTYPIDIRFNESGMDAADYSIE
jgi:hypothetical protein